jgi:preprotein translocase subunit SecF
MEKYMMLLVIPALILAGSLAVLYNNVQTTGFLMQRDVELTGGLSITITTNQSVDPKAIEAAVPGASVRIAQGYGASTIVIQTQELDKDKVLGQLSSAVSFDADSADVGVIEPGMGEVFWNQAQMALILAFVFMSIVVLVLFRSLVPSFTVILCAVVDITMTVAAISLLGVKLSLPVFAGLLMLIGYSVDTDILLTTRALKGAGTRKENIYSAMKTGLTMTLTSIAAVFSLFVFSQGTIISEIATVLLVGLAFDMLNTWVTNVGILRYWLERKELHKR